MVVNDKVILVMMITGVIVLLSFLLRHTKRVSRRNPYLQWFHSEGKLLEDYDAEQKQIDEYMK